jgi:hypothetical protein
VISPIVTQDHAPCFQYAPNFFLTNPYPSSINENKTFQGGSFGKIMPAEIKKVKKYQQKGKWNIIVID